MPRHATPRHATPRHATPCHATPGHATPRHATPRHARQTDLAIGNHWFNQTRCLDTQLFSFERRLHFWKLCNVCGDLVLACLVVNWPRGVIWGSTIGNAECKTTQNKVLKHKVKKGGYSRGGYHTGGVAVATPKCGCSPVAGLGCKCIE